MSTCPHCKAERAKAAHWEIEAKRLRAQLEAVRQEISTDRYARAVAQAAPTDTTPDNGG
jgi:hypothetical protein